MKNLFSKKNGSKGFTLAELLVVIAILAILIAIAIPVFSGMVAEANLRVNQANVRTVRSAGVAHILTHLEDNDNSETPALLNLGLNTADDKNNGWVAVAYVDNNGDITALKVFVIGDDESEDIENYESGIKPGENDVKTPMSGEGFYELSDDLTEDFATVRPTTGKDTSGKQNTVYTVQAVITDLEKDA